MYLKLFNDFYPPFRRSWSLALMMIRGSECQSGDYPGWNKRFYKWKLSNFSTNLFYWFPLAFCQLIIPRRIRIVTLLPPQQHNVTITVFVSAMCNPYTTKLGRISVTLTHVCNMYATRALFTLDSGIEKGLNISQFSKSIPICGWVKVI